MKVTFDATIDDFVDANNRLLKRSKLVRKWKWVNVGVAFAVTGAIFYFMFPGALLMRIAVSAAAGALAAALFPMIHKKEVDGKLKKFFKEQLGSDGPVRVEIELSDSGLVVKQMGTMTVHDWPNILGAENAGDAVELIHRRGGITVVRSRAFGTPGEQEQFAATARRYIEQTTKHPGIL